LILVFEFELTVMATVIFVCIW